MYSQKENFNVVILLTAFDCQITRKLSYNLILDLKLKTHSAPVFICLNQRLPKQYCNETYCLWNCRYDLESGTQTLKCILLQCKCLPDFSKLPKLYAKSES